MARMTVKQAIETAKREILGDAMAGDIPIVRSLRDLADIVDINGYFEGLCPELSAEDRVRLAEGEDEAEIQRQLDEIGDAMDKVEAWVADLGPEGFRAALRERLEAETGHAKTASFATMIATRRARQGRKS